MLTANLEARFRSEIGEPPLSGRDASIGFAVDFMRLLGHALPDPVTEQAKIATRLALRAQSDLAAHEIETLVDIACRPDQRAVVNEAGLRAYAARFGTEEEDALRAALAEEVQFSSFSERYGAVSALLLLDALFAVCAEDGIISRNEIAGLQGAAEDLGVDPLLVSTLFRKHDSRHAAGDFQFELGHRPYIIGRSAGADIQLPDPQVAHVHAELRPGNEGSWRIVDRNSGRPTLLEGRPVASAPFTPGDVLRIGPYALQLGPKGRILTAFGDSAVSALSIRSLKRNIGPVALLSDVSFTAFSREVIAIVGPSGSGKTTLLSAITGIAPADSGKVLLDGVSFHAQLEANRSMVGIVPQEDVVHGELTVEESLRWAGRLRLGQDVSSEEVDAAVQRVLAELGIQSIHGSRIGDAVTRGISGGQRKRVSLGHELLTRSTRVLFLDEPTSGLDPRTAQDIVAQARQLADNGRIVFLVTHDVSPMVVNRVDHLLVLAPGGHLAWFGPPSEACDWFNVQSPDEIFGVLSQQSSEEWARRYQEGPAFRKYVRTREHLMGLAGLTSDTTSIAAPVRQSQGFQLKTLVSRYATVKLRDRAGTAILLAQAPLLAVATVIVFPHGDPAMVFVMVLSSLWFGASSAIRELISERPIWRRERRIGLGVVAYMASKVAVLGALVTLQCLLLTVIVWGALGLSSLGFGLPSLALVMCFTGYAGTGLGLFLSSIFKTSEAAIGSLPLVLIPQITFGGLIVKVKDMSSAAAFLSNLTITRHGFEAAISMGECLNVTRTGGATVALPVHGVLADLGFHTSAADGGGGSTGVLLLVLAAFAATFILAATWLTNRVADA